LCVAHADSESYGHSNGNIHIDSYCNSYVYSNNHCYGHVYADSNSYSKVNGNCNCDCGAEVYADAQAASDARPTRKLPRLVG
jgi:hypothetical protein